MAVKPELNAIVSQKIDVSSNLIILRVVPDGWELSDFESGQFTMVGLFPDSPRHPSSDPDSRKFAPDKLIKRAYSITSASMAKEYLEFYIAIVRSGDLTPRLHNLNVGDKLWLSNRNVGMFTLQQVPPKTNIVLAATGTGVAPYISMIRSKLTTDQQEKVAIIHGARHSWDLGYSSELNTLQRICPNFTYIPIIDHPDEEPINWNGETGFIHDLWDSKPLQQKWGEITPENTHIFLCGNPLMIEAMTKVLEQQNFSLHSKKSPGQIHTEAF